jgi:hypothetical protein
MRETLKILNELQQSGLYKRYAIGGAIAAFFYMEPTATQDLDIFVALDAAPADLDPFKDINAELRKRNFNKDGIYDLIAGVPVQFLPAYPALVAEAVESALDFEYEGVPTKVLSAEYLLAIMVLTGRAKDRARAVQMLEEAPIDHEKLAGILTRYDLISRYQQWTS